MLALAGQQVLAESLPGPVPAALVMNTHITGLAVARSLGRAGVPVVGLDDERGGLGQSSRHLAGLGLVPGPTVDDGRALLVPIGLGPKGQKLSRFHLSAEGKPASLLMLGTATPSASHARYSEVFASARCTTSCAAKL